VTLEALKLLDGLPQVRVLCLGDLMLDRYIYGSAERLSPEAPVPVVLVRSRRIMPGGLGNVALNLAALKAGVLLAAVTGEDRLGRELASLLAESFEPGQMKLLADPSRPTTVKTRLIAGIQQVVRFDEESARPLDPALAEAYRRSAAEFLPRAGACALSDYGKGVLTAEMTSWLIAEAGRHGCPVVIDPKGSDYRPYRGAALVTPNRTELALACGRPLDKTSGDELAEAGRQVMADCGIKNLLITRSEDGMTLLTEDGGVRHLPTRAQAVFDVSGAGDTVMGVMAAAVARGVSLQTGAELAALAAGVVVGKVGTACASPEEIRSSRKQSL
jgi:D-beta-D-heptose 7-phosphate kinase/D-beta-D-heptose 1-phosphate adenosyltransferase